MSDDIKVTDGTILEALNGKVDLDGGNFAGSGLEAIVKKNGGGGLEIGDIGFTQMAIDETKGKRRVLNGQLIIQDQYVQFTNIIKNSVALNPDLACTEAEWQTEVTMNTFGLCGKFVIDDEGGTIRLPKYPNYFIAGLSNIAPVVGNGTAPVFYDGTNERVLNCYQYGASWGYRPTNGKVGSASTQQNGVTNVAYGFSTDPTKSGIEAQINEKQIAGTYFIQVATGSETEDNIINEIELNNPFSLLDYKFSEYELNNLSWLRSNGQWNSKAVYPAVYDLLSKIYNGAETKAGVSVKLSTASYTDTDFVLNTAEETFRLPIKVKLASGKAVVGNGMVLGLTDGNKNYGLTVSQGGVYLGYESDYGRNVGSGTSALTGSFALPASLLGITTDPLKSGIETSDSDLYLYFYVGETVQNANLINAGRIEEKLTGYLSKNNKEEIVSWGMPDYSAGVIISSGYVAPTDGFIQFYAGAPGSSSYTADLKIASSTFRWKLSSVNMLEVIYPVNKGDVITITGTASLQGIFYPLKGAK